MVLLGLGLAERLTLSILPTEISGKIKADIKLQELIRLSETNMSMTGANDVLGLDPKFSTMRFTVRDNFIDKLRYLFKIIFCPSKAQWKKYSFPDHLSFLHYILRPCSILQDTFVRMFLRKWTKM